LQPAVHDASLDSRIELCNHTYHTVNPYDSYYSEQCEHNYDYNCGFHILHEHYYVALEYFLVEPSQNMWADGYPPWCLVITRWRLFLGGSMFCGVFDDMLFWMGLPVQSLAMDGASSGYCAYTDADNDREKDARMITTVPTSDDSAAFQPPTAYLADSSATVAVDLLSEIAKTPTAAQPAQSEEQLPSCTTCPKSADKPPTAEQPLIAATVSAGPIDAGEQRLADVTLSALAAKQPLADLTLDAGPTRAARAGRQPRSLPAPPVKMATTNHRPVTAVPSVGAARQPRALSVCVSGSPGNKTPTEPSLAAVVPTAPSAARVRCPPRPLANRPSGFAGNRTAARSVSAVVHRANAGGRAEQLHGVQFTSHASGKQGRKNERRLAALPCAGPTGTAERRRQSYPMRYTSESKNSTSTGRQPGSFSTCRAPASKTVTAGHSLGAAPCAIETAKAARQSRSRGYPEPPGDRAARGEQSTVSSPATHNSPELGARAVDKASSTKTSTNQDQVAVSPGKNAAADVCTAAFAHTPRTEAPVQPARQSRSASAHCGPATTTRKCSASRLAGGDALGTDSTIPAESDPHGSRVVVFTKAAEVAAALNSSCKLSSAAITHESDRDGGDLPQENASLVGCACAPVLFASGRKLLPPHPTVLPHDSDKVRSRRANACVDAVISESEAAPVAFTTVVEQSLSLLPSSSLPDTLLSPNRAPHSAWIGATDCEPPVLARERHLKLRTPSAKVGHEHSGYIPLSSTAASKLRRTARRVACEVDDEESSQHSDVRADSLQSNDGVAKRVCPGEAASCAGRFLPADRVPRSESLLRAASKLCDRPGTRLLTERAGDFSGPVAVAQEAGGLAVDLGLVGTLCFDIVRLLALLSLAVAECLFLLRLRSVISALSATGATGDTSAAEVMLTVYF
jgi:hypothetical protein